MSTIKTDVEFGRVYRDKVSGFSGVAVAITKWQYGCVRVSLQPKVGDDGKLNSSETFDEGSLEEITPREKTTGGPTPAIKHYPSIK